MRGILRVSGYLGVGVLALATVGVAAVYVSSERTIRQTWDVPLAVFDVPELDGAAAASEDLAEGERLSRILGCYGGCHGATLEGGVFFEEPGVARLAAPNLSTALREQSDSELERVIRRGVLRDGRSVFAMPSPMFQHLADEDLVKILRFLRSQPEAEGDPGPLTIGPLGRLGLALGQLRPLASEIHVEPPVLVPRDDERAWGRYLAMTACSECHGQDLNGDPRGPVPSLRMAFAYPEEEWFRLLREGTGLGDRELGLMGAVARSRFRHFTDDEIRVLRSYLLSWAGEGGTAIDGT